MKKRILTLLMLSVIALASQSVRVLFLEEFKGIEHDAYFVVKENPFMISFGSSVMYKSGDAMIPLPEELTFRTSKKCGYLEIMELGEDVYHERAIFEIANFILKPDLIEDSQQKKLAIRFVEKILEEKTLYESSCRSFANMELFRSFLIGREYYDVALWELFEEVIEEVYENLSSRRKSKLLIEMISIGEYLYRFDYQSELARSKNKNFIETNPAGENDPYAMDYAFCFRRIQQFQQAGKGFDKTRLLYWHSRALNLFEMDNVSR